MPPTDKQTQDMTNLLVKLLDENTRVCQSTQISLVRIEGTLERLVKDGDASTNTLKVLATEISDIKNDNRLVFNEMFGTETKKGMTSRMKDVETTIADWISQSKVWRWALGTVASSGFVMAVFNYFTKVPPANGLH